jgi:hypothetical protein
LGTAGNAAYGQPWMLPCTPAESMRALVARFSRCLDRDIRLAVMPRWAMKALGLAVPMIREINEMTYQWDEPFIIDDRRFRATFNTGPLNPGALRLTPSCGPIRITDSARERN